ncbi:hypothetical protein CkaCkLH20_13285 [Colletotrichum karsti]|uniref:Uncharacterized protein n=1 Tax=Colletotrichum karsti TaxID=1095194 RepID=A0A9P6HSW6_9PEZI|nr:uncharacterized protein CkaCkLH20_13285 [Colletotrichum karsti]KAF9869240.1 hypothetical protein CkaCkLH20_13285 [Colletotrichum karsti]
MHRRYNPDRWAAFRREKRSEYKRRRSAWYDWRGLWRHRDKETFPATFVAQTESGTQYFTILPHRDLIIIRREDKMPPIDYLIEQLLPFSNQKFGYEGVAHIAVEFDPSWSADEVEQCRAIPWYSRNYRVNNYQRWDCYSALAKAVRPRALGNGLTRVWVVDYRLRRKIPIATAEATENARTQSPDDEGLVFEGQGCKYFAMPNSMVDSYCCYDAIEGPTSNNVFDFVRAIERLACQFELDDWPWFQNVQSRNVGVFNPRRRRENTRSVKRHELEGKLLPLYDVSAWDPKQLPNFPPTARAFLELDHENVSRLLKSLRPDAETRPEWGQMDWMQALLATLVSGTPLHDLWLERKSDEKVSGPAVASDSDQAQKDQASGGYFSFWAAPVEISFPDLVTWTFMVFLEGMLLQCWIRCRHRARGDEMTNWVECIP